MFARRRAKTVATSGPRRGRLGTLQDPRDVWPPRCRRAAPPGHRPRRRAPGEPDRLTIKPGERREFRRRRRPPPSNGCAEAVNPFQCQRPDESAETSALAVKPARSQYRLERHDASPRGPDRGQRAHGNVPAPRQIYRVSRVQPLAACLHDLRTDHDGLVVGSHDRAWSPALPVIPESLVTYSSTIRTSFLRPRSLAAGPTLGSTGAMDRRTLTIRRYRKSIYSGNSISCPTTRVIPAT